MPISEAITRLTGITNKRVAKAPIFDDVAEVIYGMLANTTFVAHNVNFDLPFLNHELERVGFPALTGPAIDTVQLSQILLPTATSYRLQDLSQLFSISHENPHSADSDAEATANLLIFFVGSVTNVTVDDFEAIESNSSGAHPRNGHLVCWGDSVREPPSGALAGLFVNQKWTGIA